VYAVAAVALLAMAVAAGENLALPLAALGFVTALALGPQLVGHTAFNYAVRHLPAPVVAVAILGEPLGSALLAWLLFDETVGAGQLAGFGVLLAGILLSVLADARPTVPATSADK
jgi:drug/metabolite transporter (DMT)-like permease